MQDVEQRADREAGTKLESGLELCPGPAVHSHLAPLAAFAVTVEQRTSFAVQVVPLSASASLIRKTARGRTRITVRNLMSAAALVTAITSATVGGSAGYCIPLLCGG
jgi:hypothetical protein